MSEVELRPCPFCGQGNPYIVDARFVHCSNDDCQGTAGPSNSEAEAIAMWNKGAGEDAN